MHEISHHAKEENNQWKNPKIVKTVFEVKALENTKLKLKKLTPMDESTSRVVSPQKSLQNAGPQYSQIYMLGKREEYIIQVTQIYFHNNIWNEMDTTGKLPTVRCFHTAKFAVVRLCESGRQSAVRYPHC